MPGHQVTFQAIRGVVSDFLTNILHVAFEDMQPTHLGQAFVRFKHAYDRDRLIQQGPFMFGDVSISFVDHNKGRNWRAVNFNRECWLLLLGFPPEFREDNFVVNSISSFGRVISWVDDGRHLSRILVKARVIDLESVPQFLVLTDGEGFQGESWTVQCEVLQGNLLGALPQDEAPAPGPDDFPPGGPFDLFGFGQQGPGPAPPNPNVNAGHNLFQAELPEGDAFQGNHNVQNVQAQDLQGFQGQNMQVQNEGWNEWPDNEQLVGGFDLNENPEDVQGLDLNEVPDPQEMIIDPVFPGPQMLNQQMNAFLDQVNEGEEDAQFVQEQLAPIEAELAQALAAPQRFRLKFLPLTSQWTTSSLWTFKKMILWVKRKSNI